MVAHRTLQKEVIAEGSYGGWPVHSGEGKQPQHFAIDLGLGYGVFTTKNEYDTGQGTSNQEDSRGGVTLEIGFTAFL
jgi:hypothetical protein